MAADKNAQLVTSLCSQTFWALWEVYSRAVVKKPAYSQVGIEGHPVAVIIGLADIKAFILI